MRSLVAILLLLSASCSQERARPTTTDHAIKASRGGQAPKPGAPEGYLGVVTSQQSQVVTAVSGGKVAALLVNIGDRVEKGQELVRLDLEALRSELEVALAAQSSALAARLKASIEVDEANRQLTLSRRLFRDNVRSRESVEQASFGLRRARANLREFGGVVQQRAAQIVELREKLSQRAMTATMSGVVSSIETQAGATVQSGQRLLRVIAAEDLAVRFAVPTAELPRLSKGIGMEMITDGKVVDLIVVSVSPDIDPGLQLAFALAVPDASDALAGITPGSVAVVRHPGDR